MTARWTPQLLDRLARMHGDGMSATLIARELNNEFSTQFTRNAVIGACYRANLPKRQSTKMAGTHAIERRRNHDIGTLRRIDRREFTGSRPLPKQKISSAPFLGVALLDLKDGQCRFPRGDTGSILFCGQPAQENSSYCPHCHSIAYEVRKCSLVQGSERNSTPGEKIFLFRLAR